MDHLNNRFTSSHDETNNYAENSPKGMKTDSFLTLILILGGLFGLYYVPKTAFGQPSGEEAVNIRLTSSNFSKQQTAKLMPGKTKKKKQKTKRVKRKTEAKPPVQLPIELAVIGSQETGNQLAFFIQGFEAKQQYIIDFGDGNQEVIETATFEYTYNVHGNYEVKLQTAQDNGETEVTSTTVLNIESPVLSSIKSDKTKI